MGRIVSNILCFSQLGGYKEKTEIISYSLQLQPKLIEKNVAVETFLQYYYVSSSQVLQHYQSEMFSEWC